MLLNQENLILVAYFTVPLVLKAIAPRRKVIDILVVLGLWLPVEFYLHNTLWVPIAGGLELVMIYQFLWPIQKTWRMGFRFSLSALWTAIQGLLALAGPLLAVGFILGFIRWAPFKNGFDASMVPLVFLFALLEEILFRGVIQNLLEKPLRNEQAALVVTSIIFGLSHLNNQVNFPAHFNGKYAVMASIAGYGYGNVWLRTRSIWASTITHTLVNVLWRLLLR